MDLTPDLFSSIVESAFKAIHDFYKPLINMMKAAGWDVDAAANSIEPNVMPKKLTKNTHLNPIYSKNVQLFSTRKLFC